MSSKPGNASGDPARKDEPARPTPKKKDRTPSGVRGPGGPPAQQAQPAARKPAARPGAQRSALERRSYPLLRWLQGVPRWILVVVPAILLFAGLIMPPALGWLGGILLLLVAVFLGWLLLLSWPALTQGSRTVRVITVAAVVGIAVLKFLGRF